MGLVGSILAGLALEHAGDGGPSPVFMALYGAGFLAGLVSTWHLAKVPEPGMAPVEVKLNLRKLLRQPLRDRNFRRLIVFLAAWQFAVNSATPFFTWSAGNLTDSSQSSASGTRARNFLSPVSR